MTNNTIYHDNKTDYQTKALHANHEEASEINAAFNELMHQFEEFKQANDERLHALEQKNPVDILLEEKIDRIGESLDAQQDKINQIIVKSQRPGFEKNESTYNKSHNKHNKGEFNTYIRKGLINNNLSLKAAEISTAAGGGGVLVPEEIEDRLARAMSEISPIRKMAEIKQISTGDFKKPVSKKNAGAQWVAENADRNQTTTPDILELTFPIGELYALPAATQTILDDAQLNVEEWLVNEIQYSFIEKEQNAFINGDGANKPKGILNYNKITTEPNDNNSTQYVPSGLNNGFHATKPIDAFIDLIHALKAEYRQNATWMLNRTTLNTIRKFKDQNGNYIWQPSIADPKTATIFGYPVTEIENMPNVTSGTFPIIFGNLKRGYLIIDRTGINVLRDPYSKKPYVLFYVTKRVGGGIQDFNALKLMKIAAS